MQNIRTKSKKKKLQIIVRLLMFSTDKKIVRCFRKLYNPHNILLDMYGRQENSKICCIKVKTLEKGLVVTKNYKCERCIALITKPS